MKKFVFAMVMMFGVSSAMAGMLTTGFESPNFNTGWIAGQDGWQSFVTSTTEGHIDSSNPYAGDQHLRISYDADQQFGDPVGAFSPAVGHTAGANTALKVLANVSSLGGASYEIVAQSISEGSIVGEMQFFWADFDGDSISGDILVNDGGVFVDSGADFVPGEYREASIEAYPGTNTLDYYYDGSLIYSTSLFAGTLVEQAIFMSDNYEGSEGDFDNIMITPEPASLATLVIGAALLRRRG